MTGSISFYDKVVDGTTVNSCLRILSEMPTDSFTWGALFAGGITSVAALLFIGATGKSAQIPLFVWLPDAMAGPTPVSALIHAATMVTAGVYMVVRCNGIYQNAPSAMFIVALIGAATAIFAATIGLAQNDIKKVLAYSTVSQLGYMFLACGVGAFGAAIFHVMTHAFFKALLFPRLRFGHSRNAPRTRYAKNGRFAKIYADHAHHNASRLAGDLRNISVGGIFLERRNFVSRLLPQTELGNWSYVLWIVGVITAILTAIYMTRLMVMTFWSGGTI